MALHVEGARRSGAQTRLCELSKLSTCVVELELVDLQLADWQRVFLAWHHEIPQDILHTQGGADLRANGTCAPSRALTPRCTVQCMRQ